MLDFVTNLVTILTPAKDFIKLYSCLLLHPRYKVAICVGCQTYGVMPEPLLNHLERNTLGQE